MKNTTKKKKTRAPGAGRPSLFVGKVRGHPISLTLTPEHHKKLRRAMRRLGVTRADTVALLIDRYADVVELPDG